MRIYDRGHIIFRRVSYSINTRVRIHIIRIYFREHSSRHYAGASPRLYKAIAGLGDFQFSSVSRSSYAFCGFRHFRFLFCNVCILIVLMSLERAVRAKVSRLLCSRSPNTISRFIIVDNDRVDIKLDCLFVYIYMVRDAK